MIDNALGHVLPLTGVRVEVTLHGNFHNLSVNAVILLRQMRKLMSNHFLRQVGVELLTVYKDLILVFKEQRNHQLTHIQHPPDLASRLEREQVSLLDRCGPSSSLRLAPQPGLYRVQTSGQVLPLLVLVFDLRAQLEIVLEEVISHLLVFEFLELGS